MKKPSLWELMRMALYIGALGYGGPAILALAKKKIVQEKKWMSENEFMGGLSLAQILPGATGVTLLGYVGQRLNLRWGGILMPAVFILPSITAMTILTHLYFVYGQIAAVHKIFIGLGALVVALLFNATFYLGKGVFKKQDKISLAGIFIAIPAFAGIFFLHWNILLIILFSGLLGFLLFYSNQKADPMKLPENHAELVEKTGYTLIDYLLAPFIAVLILILIFIFIPGTWNIFRTFFKIGMFAFGGGFTSIPLIQHEVVSKMHWITLSAFRDGIALGQITPGPVLITAAFIGYHLKGILGAVVASAGIFLPSLAAILILGETHTRIKNNRIIASIIRGFLSGFIGLLFAVTLQFGISSLVIWQTWTIFILSILYLMWWKKEPAWLILSTMAASLLIFRG